MEPLVAPLLSLLLMANPSLGGTKAPHTGATAAHGTILDGDGDGVPDATDLCPGTRREFPVGPSGCDADSDRDGVPDGLDRCTATSPGSIEVDPNGCSVRDRKKERTYRFPVGLA